MQVIKRIFDFYIFSNIHVAIASFCLTKITLLEYGIESNLVPFFVFFSTVTSYNFIRLYKVYETQYWIFKFIKEYKKIIIGITFLSLFIVLYLSFLLKFIALVSLLPFCFFTLFYVIPLPVKKNNVLVLRSVSFLKLFLIVISWTGVTVLLPIINYSILLQNNEVIIIIQRFLFLVVIALPFDIRDLKFDNKNLKTLPQVLGVQKSKVLGLLFLMLFLGLEFFKSPVSIIQFRTHLIIAILSLVFLFRSTPNQNKYYSAFFVESLPIVWLLLLFIF